MLEAKIVQSPKEPTSQSIDKLRSWVLVTPSDLTVKQWSRIPYGALIHQRRRRASHDEEPADGIRETDLPNSRSTRVAHAAVAPGISAFELLTLARKLVQGPLAIHSVELPVTIVGFNQTESERIAEAVISAALARAVDMPVYKQHRKVAASLKRIRLIGFSATHRFERSVAEAQGNGLARYLTALPPNELTPANYRKRLESLAKQHGWGFDFLDLAALQGRKAGAFLAVARGSPIGDAGIAHLSYRPRGSKAGKRLALVGKGICFDTGGVNVKPNKAMLGMHTDMNGSAVALGTFLALSKLEVDFAIDCWLALAMNHIGENAYIPNEIVTALDGTTIEVIHTDAEGRMVLADTLVLVSREQPSLIVDYATLTGACVYSLGKAYSGVFTNRDDWLAALINAGRESGERVWPFPQDKDYDRSLDSAVADIKQCAIDGDADHILAARFLSRFVKHEVPWVHVDLSASSHKGGLAHVPSEVTGFGVRFSCNLVLDQKILERI